MKITIAIVLGTLVVGAASMLLPGKLKEASGADPFAGATFQVKRGPLDITVVENGYLKAKNSENLKPKYGGQSTIKWLIEEGSEVEKDELLVEFDATELENDLDETETRLIQYEAELEAAHANLEIQKQDNAATIEKAELALEVAELSLKRFHEEMLNTERLKKLEVDKATSELSRAEEAYKMVPSLEAEGFLTKIQAEEERIKLEEAGIKLQNAEKDLEIYQQYTAPMELREKEAAVRNAQRELDISKERTNINIKEKSARVAQQERHLKSAKARITEIKKDLENMKIRAPRPGIVIYGDPKNPWMTDQIQVGNNIWQGVTVITLPDLSEMQVLIDVHEADIDFLKVGQKATVTLDTYKGRVYHGDVTDVAKVATTSRWGDTSNKQFSVEITMNDLTDDLRSGITAKAEVHIERIDDVLQVPIHAVAKDGEEFVCFEPDGSGYRRRTVKIGKSNAHYVVIEEGLEEGETVLLYDPREEQLADQTADDEDGEAENGNELVQGDPE